MGEIVGKDTSASMQSQHTHTHSASTHEPRLKRGVMLDVLPVPEEIAQEKRSSNCAILRRNQDMKLVRAFVAEEEPIPGPEIEVSQAPLQSRLLICTRTAMGFLPRFCGMVPWCAGQGWASMAYQWLVWLLAVAITGRLAREAVRLVLCSEEVSQEEGGKTLSTILDTIMSLGAVLSLLASGALWHSTALQNVSEVTSKYTKKAGLLREAVKSCIGDVCCAFLAAGAILAFHALSGDGQPLIHGALSFIALLHIGIAVYTMQVCRYLISAVDAFCDNLIESPDLAEAIHNWNLFQAVCRTSCCGVQAFFAVQQATATAVALLGIFGARQGLGLASAHNLLPSLVLVLAIIRTSLGAAAVSDKCARVPMLVNSLSFGRDWDCDRMYMVEYIVHSRAGFYVFDVRLTLASVVRAFYIACAVTIGFASQML